MPQDLDNSATTLAQTNGQRRRFNVGYAQAAGIGNRQVRGDIDEISQYFSVPHDLLRRRLDSLEMGENPEILLLQNLTPEAKIRAAVFFSSVWSKAYERVGTPYGKVHRDFHYQCLFSVITLLVETGCDQIRVENPMGRHYWRKDAYICLLEATRNVKRHLNPRVSVHLEKGTYSPQMVRDVDANMDAYDMQEHRPIGTYLHVLDGLNMRTVFIEKVMHGKRRDG